MAYIPEPALLSMLFVLGLIVGSFCNVVIYRLHTNKSLQGRSHCLSCGSTLRWYDLIPVVSYIGLGGRCRHCSARIPVRYAAVELTLAITFAFLGTLFAEPVALGLHLLLVSVIIVIFVYDLRHTIIPDEMVVLLTFIALCVVSWNAAEQAFALPALSHLIGAGVAVAFFAGLWAISGGRWIGLGDAKLAFPLAFLVGWPAVISLVVWSFWVGAAISIGILGVQYALPRAAVFIRRLPVLGRVFPKWRIANCPKSFTMKHEVPFAPFLIVGFALVYIYELDVFAVTAEIFNFV